MYTWNSRFKRDGLSASSRLELRELLAPKVSLREGISWIESDEGPNETTQFEQSVVGEVVLAASEVKSFLQDVNAEQRKPALRELLNDFQQLLRDTLDVMAELNHADARSDRSHLDLPSIAPHHQNRDASDWTVLIELLRDAWIEVRDRNNSNASRIAEAWFDVPYLAFRRLALFAASQRGCVEPERWVDWLLMDDAWCLWSDATRREVCRLLVEQGRQLSGSTKARLESAILSGPPRDMYSGELEPQLWQRLVARDVWLRLVKLSDSTLELGASARARLDELTREDPGLQVTPNQREEFSHWLSASGDPDFDEVYEVDVAPEELHRLVEWLKKPHSEQTAFRRDTWGDLCRTNLSLAKAPLRS